MKENSSVGLSCVFAILVCKFTGKLIHVNFDAEHGEDASQQNVHHQDFKKTNLKTLCESGTTSNLYEPGMKC